MKKREGRFEVTEQAKLLEFLLARHPQKGRHTVKALLSRRAVSVDGRVVTRFDHLLAPGQVVLVSGSAGRPLPRGLTLVHEDEHLLVVDKPAGLLSVSAPSEREATAYGAVRDYLAAADPGTRLFVVHRLDRETSGLLLFAKSQQVQQALQQRWQEDVLERGYVAVVEGVLTPAEGTHTSWLKQNRNLLMHSSRQEGEGQKAVTHWRVLRTTGDYSLVELELETGRKNQIRVHLRELGHSVVGDDRYGSGRGPLRRLALHARVLAFRHPVSSEALRFETSIPADFLRLLSSREGPARAAGRSPQHF